MNQLSRRPGALSFGLALRFGPAVVNDIFGARSPIDWARARKLLSCTAMMALIGLNSGVMAQQQVKRYVIIDGQRYGQDQIEAAVQSPSRMQEPRCSAAECEIPRSPDGHFYVAGSLNGHPVVWMVDTGASHTSVPNGVARNAGIRAGVSAEFQTAGGRSAGALSGGNEVMIGGIRLTNVVVSMSQRLTVNLLGASALERLNITYEGGVMNMRRVR